MTLIATSLNDWLACLATGPETALARSGERFAALVSSDAELETTGAARQGSAPVVTLTVMSGLHRGASMALTAGEYLLGSGDGCDIALRDRAVEPQHCRLTREWFGFSVHDLRGGRNAQPLAPQAVNYKEGEIEAVYDIGGLTLSLRQPPPAQQQTVSEPLSGARRSWVLPAGIVGALVTAIATFVLASPALRQPQHPIATRLARVRPASELLDQVLSALGTDGVRVELNAGRLRIQGTTSQLSLKNRIRALTEDLKGTIPVEDHVIYVDERARSAPATPFPVRLRGVMAGNPSYFLTDQGARYYVGGVLPDGAEVLAIDARQIRFAKGGKVIVYNLE